MNEFKREIDGLFEFVEDSPTPFHVVDNIRKHLVEAGFQELRLENVWTPNGGGKYFVTHNDSSIFAFTLGNESLANSGLKIIATHSDSPALKLKPSPEILGHEGIVRLNTEVYGGAILMSWLDRPLSVAGRVMLKSESTLRPKSCLVNLKYPIAVIPSLAIHMNRQVNSGVELNPQIDMLPVLSSFYDEDNKSDLILNKVAQSLNVSVDDILDADLILYNAERGKVVGLDYDMMICPRLDDLSMVYAGMKALISTEKISNNLFCVFDNEEIGSGTKQGALSPTLKHILERITDMMGMSVEDYHRMIYNSFMISADQAHAFHPNYSSKYDPIVRASINRGPVIKYNAKQKYMTDADSASVFITLCKNADVPFQKYVNRSDMSGGSTLGNLFTSQLDIRGVDVGNPILAMHSSVETGGVLDQWYITKVFEDFYSC